MNRRDFLKGSLTLAGLGLTGCPSGRGKFTPHPLPAGSRRDPDFRSGHMLWDKELPTEISSMEEREGVILGGGVAGLSAGWCWSRLGFENYRLLEIESEVGGNSRALSYPPTKAPIGAHYLPVPNEEAIAVRLLLEEMGLLKKENGRWSLSKEHLCHSRQERLFYEGFWYDGLIPHEALTSETEAQIEAFRAHTERWKEKRDKKGRKIFALPLHYSSREPQYLALDRISFAQYASEQGWDDPFLLWFLEYACRDDFGGGLHSVSAWAGLHYFCSRDGGGLAGSDDILVWPEGNNRLVQFMRARQKGEVTTDALVTKVAETPDGVEVDYLSKETSLLHRVKAKVAVFCLPTFLRPHVLEKSGSLEAFQYPPWVTANLLFDKTPSDLEPPGYIAWDNVLFDSTSLGYVVATHQSLNTAPNQPTVWTWYRPFTERSPSEVRKELLESSWSHWSETVLNDLELVHKDIRTRCRQLDVTILGHGMIRPSVDFIWGKAMEEARRNRDRIFFGHGDLSGMSLFEESQFRGVRAAEEALSRLGFPKPILLQGIS